jgi:hypothetical protein
MLIKDVIARLRELHEKSKCGSLTSDDVTAYSALRDDFYGGLVRAQRLGLQSGQKARQTVRVASAKQIQLTVADSRQDTMTCDLGVAGFAALVNTDLPVGTPCDFVLSAGGNRLRGQARVVACMRHGSGGLTHRASFVLEAMSEEDRARLETSVLDAALALLTR